MSALRVIRQACLSLAWRYISQLWTKRASKSDFSGP
jgi:hypothetical protein